MDRGFVARWCCFAAVWGLGVGFGCFPGAYAPFGFAQGRLFQGIGIFLFLAIHFIRFAHSVAATRR